METRSGEGKDEVPPPMNLEYSSMKTSLRLCAFLFLAASASAALAQPSARGPEEDAYCAQRFTKSQASLSCNLISARGTPSGGCHIAASCAVKGGGQKTSYWLGNWSRVENLCNKNGQLDLGCAPL